MARRRLTETERTTACPWCHAKPGERCTTFDGRLANVAGGTHAARRGNTAGTAGRQQAAAATRGGSGAAPDCVFCGRVERGEYDYEDKFSVAFEPLHPVTPGHFLVVPRKHVASALESPLAAGSAASLAAELARIMDLEAFNLITSAGAAATQTVPHLHWHLVPRRAGDGLALPWTGQAEREGRAPKPPAVKLLEEALFLRTNGEYAPGGTENWHDWDDRAERFLRSLLPPEAEGPAAGEREDGEH